MIRHGEIFHSVELVWVAWLASLLLLATLTCFLLRRLRWGHLRHLAASEHGASYTLSYLLALPFFVLLIALLVECSLVLICKVGTIYSAYAAARSAAVWQSAQPDQLEQKTRLAAVHAMVPFASGASLHNPLPPVPPPSYFSYRLAYQRFASNPVDESYLRRKYAYAYLATKLERNLARDFNGDIRMVVTYRMPFHTPGVGRLLGSRSPWSPSVFTIAIRSEAIVQNDAPRPPSRRLGIRYESR